MGLNKCTDTNVNGAAKPWQNIFLKFVLWDFVFFFFHFLLLPSICSALMNSQWVLSFKHIKRLVKD